MGCCGYAGGGRKVHVLPTPRPHSIVKPSKSAIYFLCWGTVSNFIERKKRGGNGSGHRLHPGVGKGLFLLAWSGQASPGRNFWSKT